MSTRTPAPGSLTARTPFRDLAPPGTRRETHRRKEARHATRILTEERTPVPPHPGFRARAGRSEEARRSDRRTDREQGPRPFGRVTLLVSPVEDRHLLTTARRLPPHARW